MPLRTAQPQPQLVRCRHGRRAIFSAGAGSMGETVPAVVVGAGRVGQALIEMGKAQGVTDVVRVAHYFA